jgi:hypothetical protein
LFSQGLKKWPHRKYRQITKMVEQNNKLLQTDLSAADRLYHTEQLQELQALMAAVLATGHSGFCITTKRRKTTGMAVCVKAQTHKQLTTERGVKVEGGVEVKKEKEGPCDSDEAPSEIVARRRFLDGGPQTGFRSSASDLMGLIGHEAPLKEESASVVPCSDLLTMNFSEVFNDEQEASFCHALASFENNSETMPLQQ